MPTRANFEFYNKNSTITGKQFGFRSEYRTPELWNEIASYCTRGTLHSLALVNTCTTDPAQRHLFKNLSFIVPYSDYSRIEHASLEEADARLSRGMEKLEMLSSSHLSNYVRHWEFRGMVHSPEPPRGLGKSHPGIPASAKAISRLIASLPKYPLLRDLILMELGLDHSALLTISSMKNLNSLHFRAVVFEYPPVLENPLPLRQFSIENAGEKYVEGDTSSGPIFLSPHLEFLTLTYDDKREMLLSNLLCELFIYEPHTNLVELTYQIAKPSHRGIDFFFHLLEVLPLLQTVRLTIFTWFEDEFDEFEQLMDQIDLDINACPLLNNLACPPAFVTLFGRGKPITKLYLQDHEAQSISQVTDALQAINGAILTELKFERAKTRSARKILPLIHRLLPNLRVLRMLIDDLQNTDDILAYCTLDLFEDYITIKEPDNLERERLHFTACYDAPVQKVCFGKGYLRLIHNIAQGLLALPETLVTLEIPQNRACKRLAFTKEHELELVDLFARNFASKNLQSLKIGMNNAYNRNWTKDSKGRWMKQRYYHRQDERNMVGTMCFSPMPNSSQNEFARSFIDGVDAVELC